MNCPTTYIFCLVVVLASRAVAAPPAEIDPVCVDDRAIGYATFQSHNQKVVDGPGGIFMTYLHWDIHHMVSPDGGNRWRNLDGTPLQLPVTADDTGPALRITLDDEFDCHTWLSSFLPKEGKLHFLYQAQCKPARQHYVRYDIATGKREEDVQPRFAGQDIELRGLGGFLATRGDRPNSPLYCIGNDHGRIACLASFDNGRHWRDQARGKKTFNLYSPGGCRRITDDGHVIGSFTDQVGSNATNDRRSRVYFFRF